MLLYSRELPGGGLVTIEADAQDGVAYHAQLAVERRVDPKRRIGHVAPIIAQADGPSRASVFKELYGIASDNVAIARGLIRWQTRKRAD